MHTIPLVGFFSVQPPRLYRIIERVCLPFPSRRSAREQFLSGPSPYLSSPVPTAPRLNTICQLCFCHDLPERLLLCPLGFVRKPDALFKKPEIALTPMIVHDVSLTCKQGRILHFTPRDLSGF